MAVNERYKIYLLICVLLIFFAIIITPMASAVSGTIVNPVINDITKLQVPGYILKPSLTVDATASPATVDRDKPSTVTVTVKDVNGSALSGAMVKLTATGGTVKENAGFTNAQGKFTTTFQSSTSGTFTINATASSSGYWDTTKTVQVTIPNTPPTAAFSATPTTGPEPLNVTFDASKSKDVDGTIAAYDWDFGDGQKGTGQAIAHNYTLNGTYAAVLTVTDNLGATNSYSSQITVAVNKTAGGFAIDGGILIAIAAVIIIVLLALIILLYLWLKSTLRITPKATKVAADGKSTAPIKVMFVNGLGMAKRQGSDVEVEMTTTAGKIDNIVIPNGRDFVEAKLTSSPEFGPVTVTAKAKGKTAKAELSFAYDKAVFEVAVSPDSIPADGKSSANVVIRIKDGSGNVIAPLEEKIVDLKSTLGTIASPVRLLSKMQAVSSSITSGEVSGTAVITAASGDLRGEGKLTLVGMPKRFCMHCGSAMAMEATKCPKCGLTPPSGVDTKPCATCGTILPEPAKFCYKCGARQPEAANKK